MGAVLEQQTQGHWQPLAFFSRQFNKTEKKYATFDRELLGVYSAILHFRYFLEGRKFTVFTDQNPIVSDNKKKTDLKSGQQTRQLATISEFTTDFQHMSGKDNVVADAISRIPSQEVKMSESIRIMVGDMQPFGHGTTPNDSLPSTSKWSGRTSHHDLKASLKCLLNGPNWIDELPWVLLHISTAPKEDLGSLTAELVYGSPLTVPGDFVPDGQPQPASPELQQQRQRVGDLRPVPTTAHREQHIRTKVSETLRNAKFVFIRRDARKDPLQTPYDGLFEVLEGCQKHFKIEMGNVIDTVSINCLKLAHSVLSFVWLNLIYNSQCPRGEDCIFYPVVSL